MDTTNYVISGGKEGKSRLDLLSRIMYPYTQNLLQKAGVSQGNFFLDIGCGNGAVSIMAAKMTGPQGKVKAVDFDKEVITLAQIDSQKEHLDNIAFEAMSAYDLSFTEIFDFAYARFLLSHLQHPLQVIQKMQQSVRQGGKIIAEDIQFSGHFSHPFNAAYQQYIQLYTEVVKRKGGNANLGPSLVDLFKEAGIGNIEFDVVQPCFMYGEQKWLSYITMEKIQEAVIQEKLATKQEIHQLLIELHSFTADKNSIIGLPRIFRVWGTRIQ